MVNDQAIMLSVDQSIIEDIKKELRLQGHFLTGALEASLKEKLISEDGALILSAEAAGYIDDLEIETSGSQINLSADDFNNLCNWVKLRGMAGNDIEATSVALAIIKTWKRTQRPTSNSLQFSQTGKRTEAIEDTFNQNEQKYAKMIDDGLTQILNDASSIQEGVI